jgi:N-acetyl sugar amidotransferase
VADLTPLYRETRPYRRCARCVLDTVGPHPIEFDDEGVCDYCRRSDAVAKGWSLSPGEQRIKFEQAIGAIKAHGRGREYDSILGLSGGVDSSYIAYLAMQHGLRPLIVHLDNSWNSELAVKNIENIVNRTGFEYYNYVIDWEEFKDVQLAYLRSSVIDTEVVTDQAIFAILHIMAHKLGIKYILFGDNPKSERTMPSGWNYQKNDLANVRAIHCRYGRRKLRSYPLMGLYDLEWYRKVAGISYVSLLHYVDVSVSEMKATLEREFGWRDYLWKHCESVFTQFYQGYILPKKFGVDKRKAHITDEVLSGLISREEAIKRLEKPYYTDEELRRDYDFVTRKFGLTPAEFEEIMALPPVLHSSFAQEKRTRWWSLKIRLWQIWVRLSGFCAQSCALCRGPRMDSAGHGAGPVSAEGSPVKQVEF